MEVLRRYSLFLGNWLADRASQPVKELDLGLDDLGPGQVWRHPLGTIDFWE